MANKVSLEDVAKRAGVHRSTVSLALRDHPRISGEVRVRIRKLAEDMGYRINPLVAALMQSRRGGKAQKHVTLAFVTNYPTRYGWRPPHHPRPDFFPGAVRRAQELGYKLEHFWLAEPGMTPERFCNILTTRGIHGLIIGRLPPGQQSMDLLWGRFSTVTLGMTLRQPRLHHVTENHFDTVNQAMRKYLERGYQRVGFVFSEANDSPRVGDRWLGAYLLQQRNWPATDRLPVCPEVPASEAVFRAWFQQNQPDGILATHARPVLGWLDRMKVEAGREVGIVDLENDPELECAGVHHDPGKIGALAVEMLVGMLHRNEVGIPADLHEVLLNGVWHDGWSLPPKGAAVEVPASSSTRPRLSERGHPPRASRAGVPHAGPRGRRQM